MERKLWPDGGYYLDNAASVCDKCHIKCERSEFTVEQVREAAKITRVVLPPQLDLEVRYTKWGKAMFNLDNRIKYPKTMHLPWSPGLQNDDRLIESLEGFAGKKVVVTQKMDGENTTMYRDAIHARSLDVAFTHPSRAWVRALHGNIKHEIPDGWRLCGENLYAEHSIKYNLLPSYFMLFSVWNEKNECLSWADTLEWAELLGLKTVPEVWKGSWEKFYAGKDMFVPVNPKRTDWESSAILGMYGDVEGYVVRVADSYHYDDFQKVVAKYVRKNHVQTDEHWMSKPVSPNGLSSDTSREAR